MSNDPDHDLLAAWRDGRDEHAFAALVARHAPLVYGTCRRVCRASADADDAAQETFAALAREPRPIAGPLPAWLHTVATRRAWRAIRRRRWRSWRAAPPEVGSEAPASDLDHAVASLPPEERDIVVLTYFEGETQQQVAERIGVHQSTVHRRLRDGLARLRRRLATALTIAIAAKPALTRPVVARWTQGALTGAPGGSASAAGRALAATGAIACSLVAIGAIDGWMPRPRPEGISPREWFDAIMTAAAVVGGMAVVAAVVEWLAWRRTRRGAPWIGLALTPQLVLKHHVLLSWGGCLFWPGPLQVGGWMWTTAIVVTVFALAGYVVGIVRQAAPVGGRLTAARALIAGLALVGMIDAAASIRVFRGRPDRAEWERRDAAEHEARDEQRRIEYAREGKRLEIWTTPDGRRHTRITPLDRPAPPRDAGP